MVQETSLLVIVPEYGNRKSTEVCVKSIIAQCPLAKIVVGNDGDNTLSGKEIKDAIVVDFFDNVGYTRNTNRIFRWAYAGHENNPPDYILLSNNDVVYALDSIQKLIEAASIGALAGPHLFNPTSSSPDPHIQYRLDHITYKSNLVPCTAISGCALMMPTKLFLDLNGYDEAFNIYYSDDDFCIRASKSGYPVVYVPAATVEHKPRTTIEKAYNGVQLRALRQKDLDVFTAKYPEIGHDFTGEYSLLPKVEAPAERIILQTRQNIKGRGCCNSNRTIDKFWVLTVDECCNMIGATGPFNSAFKAVKTCGKWQSNFNTPKYNTPDNIQFLIERRILTCAPNSNCRTLNQKIIL